MSVAAGKKPVGGESQRLNEGEGEAVTDVTGMAVRGNVVVFEGRVFPLRDCVVFSRVIGALLYQPYGQGCWRLSQSHPPRIPVLPKRGL